MTERLSHADMAFELDKLVYSKTVWLADYAQGPRRRPEHEADVKRRELAVLRQAADDYRRAAERAA
jgi:hypothetical protein